MTDDGGYAVGFDGSVFTRENGGWVEEATGLDVFETLHAVWADPDGGVWAVGGQLSNYPLNRGVLIRKAPRKK
jgi:hypothetical protein